jgi:hypothetical protein
MNPLVIKSVLARESLIKVQECIKNMKLILLVSCLLATSQLAQDTHAPSHFYSLRLRPTSSNLGLGYKAAQSYRVH